MADGSVTIEVTLTKDQLEKGLRSLKSTINSALPNASKTLFSFANGFSKLGSLATSAGKACSIVTGGITGIFAVAGAKAKNFVTTYEGAINLFKKKLGDTGAKEMYESLLKIAKGSTFAQESIVKAGQTMVAMGVNGQKTAKYMQLVTDAVAGMGGSGADIESLGTAIGKMSNQVTLHTDDLNQLATQGLPVWDVLAKKYKKTKEEVQDMASKGMIPATETLDFLSDALEGNIKGFEEWSVAGNAMSQKGGTLKGALDGLNSSIRSFGLNLLGMNINKDQVDNYKKLIDLVNLFGKTIENVGNKFFFVSDWVGIGLDKAKIILEKFNETLNSMKPEQLQQIAKIILGIATAGPALLSVGKGFNILSGAFSGLSSVAGILSKISGPLGTVTTKLMGVMGISDTMVSKIANIGGIFSKVFGIAGAVGLVVAGLGLLEGQFGTQIDSILNMMMIKGPEIITNLLTGISKKIPELISLGGQLINKILGALIVNLPAIIKGGMEIISSLVIGISGQLPNLIPMAIDALLVIVTSLIDNIDLIIEAGLKLILGLAQGLIDSIPVVINRLPELINSIITAILGAIPLLIDAGIQLFVALVQALPQIIVSIISVLPQIITSIITALLESLPLLINAGIQLFVALVEALPEIITQIVSVLPQIIDNIINSLMDSIPLIIEAGIQLFIALIGALPQIIKTIVKATPQIISSLVVGIINGVGSMIDAGQKLLSSLVDGIRNKYGSLGNAANEIISTIWNRLKELPGKALQWGKDMIQGFIDGIKNMLGNIASAAKGVADKVKSFLHFSRPDEGPLRNYETWMPDMVKGLSKTLKNSSPELYNASKKLSEKITNGLDVSNIYKKMQSTIDFENQKLSTNLTSSAILTIERKDNLQAKLESIDNNREIVVNSKIELDGKVAAKAVNRANAKQKLRYGVT